MTTTDHAPSTGVVESAPAMDPSSYPDEGRLPSADIIPFRRPLRETPPPEPATAEDSDGNDDGPTAA